MENKLYFGACYYPEQWEPSRWRTDLELMEQAGINIVRLADLSWSVLEPREGEFDFSLFDQVLDLLQEKGMKAILCTPTMVPPMWMWKKYPDIFATYPDVIEQSDEIRSRVCFNNPDFRRCSLRITEEMARHFSGHPAVAAWQIDNEINANKCCCPHCAAAFRRELQKKYHSLDGLNKAWGTVFWSMIYDSWEQVAPPSAKTELTFSVSQELDYRRFCSQSAVRFLSDQIDIVRRFCPNHCITHNGMTLFMNIDYFDLGRRLDFYGIDLYPAVDFDPVRYGLAEDFSRGVTRNNFFVLEQKNGYFNYSNYNLAIPPRWVPMWTVKDIAHGANGVVYFRWRSGCYGAEQHPQGLLRHDGSPRRVYHELRDLTTALSPFSAELAGTRVEARVAMLFSYDSAWAFDTHVQNSRFDYLRHMMEYYAAFQHNGVTVDVINETESLDGYDIVVAPSLFVGRPDVAQNLEAFARSGGTVLLTVRTGIRTDANTTTTESWPGCFRSIAGITVDEFDSLPEYLHNSIRYDGRDYQVGCFLDIVHTDSAQPMAVYNDKFYRGTPACTCNQVGSGRVLYSCVMNCPDFFRDLAARLCREAGIPTVPCPDSVEITRRRSGGVCFTFVINNADGTHRLHLEQPALEVLSGRELRGDVTLEPLATLVLRTDGELPLRFC